MPNPSVGESSEAGPSAARLPPRRRRRWRTWLGGTAAVAGLLVFARVFAEHDVAAVLAGLPAAMLLLIPLMGVRMVFGALSWRWSFPRLPDSRPLPWRHLFWIRLAGEGVNNGLVSAYVAGEPVKGILAARYGPTATAGLASALTGKTLHTLGEVLFILVGAGTAAWGLEATRPVAGWMLAGGAAGVLLVLVAVFVQRRRIVGRGARVLRALRLGSQRLWARALPGADAVDAAVDAYYGRQPHDVVRAIFFAFLDWALGTLEVWVFLAVATPVENPLLLAIVIEAAVDVVKGLSFFVPGSLGAQEGGIAWVFGALGIGVALGGAYAVLRRVREVVWIGLGLGALSWYLRQADLSPAGLPPVEDTA